jgi:quinol monooxygenase YgiN
VPALPWTAVSRPRDPAGACTIFAAQLPLRGYRQMPRLLWLAQRIRRRLVHTPGLLGYGLGVDVRHKTLWVSSAWTHRAALAAFDRSAAHRAAKHALRNTILPPTFVVWTCRTGQLPVPWAEARARLRAAGERR